MTRQSPPKLPTAIKLAHGERHLDRLNFNEPRPRPNRPRMPATMAEPARKVWRRVMREFGSAGVLTALDSDALRVYCEAVARYEYAADLLENAGPLIRGGPRQGELVKNPLHQIVRDNADLARVFARELGLTPSARSGLIGLPPRPDDPMERDFFRDGRDD